jgi:ABC-type multidrug transport system ATPase subunit
VIADRYDKKSFRIGGELFLNSHSSRDVGYVTQQDYLLPCLTVRETILFTAKMRVAPTDHRLTHDGYEGIVRDIMMDLGLRECAHTRIGDDIQAFGTRGISGGEKRRVSIACQIITDPAILCADEPTSGLDSFTAITVMESLKRLCSSSFHSYGLKEDHTVTALPSTSSPPLPTSVSSFPIYGTARRCPTTVICSIHQPRADVFSLFDSILLLSKGGHAVYCGPTKAMYEYFEKLSYVCPSDSNPADYFVDISSIDPTKPKHEIAREVEKLQVLVDAFHRSNNQQQWQTAQPNKSVESNSILPPPPLFTSSMSSYASSAFPHPHSSSGTSVYNSSWPLQIYHLTSRFFLNNLRSQGNLLGSLLQSLSLGLIIMGIFWNLEDSLEDIESRNGLMYLVSSMENYILLIIFVERYCTELMIFDREIQDQLYSSTCYLIAHHLSTLPMIILQSLIFALPIYLGCNLRHGSDHLLLFLIDIITISLVTNGLAWLCVTLHRNFTLASLISNTNFTFITIASGYLVATKDTPIYLRWIKHISYINYSYRILMANEYTDRMFPCPYDTSSQCSQYDGNEILASQAIEPDEDKKATTWLCLLVIGAVYHVAAGVLLEYHRFPVTGTVGIQVLEEELEDPAVKTERESITSTDEVTVQTMTTSMSGPSPWEGQGQGGKEATKSELLLSYDYPPCQAVAISIRKVSLDVQTLRTNSQTTSEEIVNPMTSPASTTAMPVPVPVSTPTLLLSSNRKVILDNISGEVEPGRLVALMGGSGSGKVRHFLSLSLTHTRRRS